MDTPRPRHVKVVELEPAAPLRVVGPGRRERSYLERLLGLESDLARGEGQRRVLARELDLSQAVERGCQRRLDRFEVRLRTSEADLRRSDQQQKRLILALGAAQRENEMLRERLQLALAGGASQPARLSGRSTAGRRAKPARRGLARVLFGR